MDTDRYMRVQPIKDGTVIDHIPPGKALAVYRALNLEPEGTISILINAISRKEGRKDILKVENRELAMDEVNKVALIAPKATINIIRDYEVVRKFKIAPPKRVKGLLRCGNPNCITNQREPVESEFRLASEKPLRLVCVYCERDLTNLDERFI